MPWEENRQPGQSRPMFEWKHSDWVTRLLLALFLCDLFPKHSFYDPTIFIETILLHLSYSLLLHLYSSFLLLFRLLFMKFWTSSSSSFSSSFSSSSSSSSSCQKNLFSKMELSLEQEVEMKKKGTDHLHHHHHHQEARLCPVGLLMQLETIFSVFDLIYWLNWIEIGALFIPMLWRWVWIDLKVEWKVPWMRIKDQWQLGSCFRGANNSEFVVGFSGWFEWSNGRHRWPETLVAHCSDDLRCRWHTVRLDCQS